MAVTGLRSAFTFAVLVLTSAFPLRADQSAEIRRRLSDVAVALAGGNAAQAMDCFEKENYSSYDKLSVFFQGLTGAYQVDSQIDVSDENIDENSATLNVRWSLTLTDPATNLDQHRGADIAVKLIKKKNGWRIVSFTPINIFDPQMTPDKGDSRNAGQLVKIAACDQLKINGQVCKAF